MVADPSTLPGQAEPESRYTPPTDACPHPEWWHSTDVDSTEIEVTALIAALVTALQPEVVVETGAAWGQTTRAIGRALYASGHGILYSTEIDQERVIYTRQLCDGLPVEVIDMPSLDFVPPASVNLAFFDSLPHLRVPEFKAYYAMPGYAPGAFVAFHDTADHHGLWPHIAQLEGDTLLPVRLPTPRGVVIAEVIPPD